jgi:TatD DNase family protein
MLKQDNHIYGAFGVHPWFVNNVADDFDKNLFDLLQSDSFYMVGEIGLDKYKPDMNKQMDVFIKQFDIAVKLTRPVFLHCVGAWDKILHVLKQYKISDLPIIVAHAFNANDKILKQLLKYKTVMFSFNKIDVYDKNRYIEQIPDNKILVETDGNKNVCLNDIIKQIAKLKNKPDMDKIIFNNTQRILKNG